MNLISSRVLGAAAVLAAPVLYEGFVTGSVAIEVALQRYLVVAVIAWIGLSALEALVGPPARAAPETDEPADAADQTAPPPPS